MKMGLSLVKLAFLASVSSAVASVQMAMSSWRRSSYVTVPRS